jgi:dsRNA-specific ribonuclease
VEASLYGLDPARGSGTTKQEAEKAAAASLLTQIPAQPAKRTRA